MKKIGTLNSTLSLVLAEMGHTDKLVIADAGLPIPEETERIDLALMKGVPGFLETLQTVLLELEVEEVFLAEEIQSASSSSSELCDQLKNVFKDVPITFISHETFKQKLSTCRAVVRTGECTPYANIILCSGVNF
jgi:D-ribose pyranase